MSTRFLEQVLTGGAGVHKTGCDAHHLGLTLGGALGRYTKELPDQSCVYISGAGWVLFTPHPPPPFLRKVAHSLHCPRPGSLIIQASLVKKVNHCFNSGLCQLPTLSTRAGEQPLSVFFPQSFPRPTHSTRLLAAFQACPLLQPGRPAPVSDI